MGRGDAGPARAARPAPAGLAPRPAAAARHHRRVAELAARGRDPDLAQAVADLENEQRTLETALDRLLGIEPDSEVSQTPGTIVLQLSWVTGRLRRLGRRTRLPAGRRAHLQELLDATTAPKVWTLPLARAAARRRQGARPRGRHQRRARLAARRRGQPRVHRRRPQRALARPARRLGRRAHRPGRLRPDAAPLPHRPAQPEPRRLRRELDPGPHRRPAPLRHGRGHARQRRRPVALRRRRVHDPVGARRDRRRHLPQRGPAGRGARRARRPRAPRSRRPRPSSPASTARPSRCPPASPATSTTASSAGPRPSPPRTTAPSSCSSTRPTRATPGTSRCSPRARATSSCRSRSPWSTPATSAGSSEANLVRLERLLPPLQRPGSLRRGEVVLSQAEAWELMTETGVGAGRRRLRRPGARPLPPAAHARRCACSPTGGDTVVGRPPARQRQLDRAVRRRRAHRRRHRPAGQGGPPARPLRRPVGRARPRRPGRRRRRPSPNGPRSPR